MNVRKGIRPLLAAALAALLVIAFLPAAGYTSLAAYKASKVTKITKANYKKNKNYTKPVGAAVTLKYKLSPSRLTSKAKKVTWKASDNNIASISNIKNGIAQVTFHAVGSVKITVKSKQNSKVKAAWKFTAVQQLTGVTVTTKDTAQDVSKSVRMGDTLIASVQPADATVSYQWYADGTAIKNATASHYNPSKANVGKTLTVKATGTGLYAGTVTSAATAAVTRTYAQSTGSGDVTIDQSPEKQIPKLTVTNASADARVDDALSASAKILAAGYYVGDVLTVSCEGVDASSYDVEWYAEMPSGDDLLLTDMTESGGKYTIPTSFGSDKILGAPTIYAVAVGKAGTDYAGSTSVSEEKSVSVKAFSYDGDTNYKTETGLLLKVPEEIVQQLQGIPKDCYRVTWYLEDSTAKGTTRRQLDPDPNNPLQLPLTSGEGYYTSNNNVEVNEYYGITVVITGTNGYTGTIMGSFSKTNNN